MADLDVRCTDGVMIYHGYGDEAEDHRTHRTTQGDMGHVWTDGLWLLHHWTGDPFLREAAERVTRRILAHFQTHSFAEEFALCERNLGWPLVVAVAALECGSRELAGEVRPFVDRMIRFLDRYTRNPDAAYQDPGMPVWWRCAMEDGSKPFMMGVLNEGLERLHRLTGREAALRILRRLARFIVDRTFDSLRMDFQYEYNAFGPNHRNIPVQHLIPLFVRGLLYAESFSKSPSSPSVAASAFHACTWCLFDEAMRGKEVTLMGRGLLPSLALLEERGRSSIRARNERACVSGSGEAGVFQAESPKDVRVPAPGFATGSARVRVLFRPGSEARTSHLNRQAFFHADAGAGRRSALGVLCFYERVQVRFHDACGDLIESLDACVPDGFFSNRSGEHLIQIDYHAPGPATLRIDGRLVDERVLDRPLGGAFRRLRAGSGPGNWGLDGWVAVEAAFGPEASGGVGPGSQGEEPE